MCTCDPRTGKAWAGRPLGLTGQLASPPQGATERRCHRNRMGSRGCPWDSAHMCRRTMLFTGITHKHMHVHRNEGFKKSQALKEQNIFIKNCTHSTALPFYKLREWGFSFYLQWDLVFCAILEVLWGSLRNSSKPAGRVRSSPLGTPQCSGPLLLV